MTSDALVGQTIAERYAVLSLLGSGGFGSVYMAKHVGLNNPVAVKVLHAHLVSDNEAVERFRREAEATSRLKHNAIASVHDFGILPDGRPFMVMEFLSGQSLGAIIDSEGRLSESRVLPLFIECCDALRYAHRKGLLHRDIKPDNIYIIRDIDGAEHAKILDFGLAKAVLGDDPACAESLTQSGTALGTPWYMSPEQCQAKPLDGRSDIYSLAYSMYEALAGKRPFNGSTQYEIMHAHLTRKVPPLNPVEGEPIVSAETEKAVLRALEKSPNDRFMTADEFKVALGGPVSGGVNAQNLAPASSPPPPKPQTVSSSGKKSSTESATLVIALIVSLTLILSGSAFAMWWQQSHNAETVTKRPSQVVAPASIPPTVPDAAANIVPPTVPAAVPATIPPVRTEIKYVAVPFPTPAMTAPQAEASLSSQPTVAASKPQPPVDTVKTEAPKPISIQAPDANLWPESALKTLKPIQTSTSSPTISAPLETPTGEPPAPPRFLPPMPYGGQPLPGNPPPGAPGHVPPPGYPQPPPYPGAQPNQ